MKVVYGDARMVDIMDLAPGDFFLLDGCLRMIVRKRKGIWVESFEIGTTNPSYVHYDDPKNRVVVQKVNVEIKVIC